MTETEITCDWIDRYNNDELDEIEKAIFQKRMLANPLLRSEVYVDACLNRFLMDKEMIDLMDKVTSASRRNGSGSSLVNMLLIAASVICLVMIGGLFYMLRTNNTVSRLSATQHTHQRNHKKGDEASKSNDTARLNNFGDDVSLSHDQHIFPGLLANNFESLAEFELLIGSATRSDQFKLISPNVNLSIPAGTEVLFAWKYDEGSEPLSMVLLNNQGIPVYKAPLDRACSYFLKTKYFMEGLYYWKIMAGDDMVLMGKLTILQNIKI